MTATPTPTPDTTPDPASLPAIFTDADLAKIAFTDLTWVIEDLLTPGLTVLAGAPKIGKGWLALQWVLDVAHGRDTIGRATLPDAETLYLALEDSPRRLASRMRASLASVSTGESGPGSVVRTAGLAAPKAHMVNTWTGGTPGMNELRVWLTANPKVKLVVIDVLTLMRGVSPSDPLSAGGYTGDYKLLRALKEVADEQNVSIVTITHTTKTRGAGDVFDTILGGRGVTGAADAMMVLEETARPSGMGSSKSSYSRWGTLAVRGRDVSDQVIPLELTDGRWIERTSSTAAAAAAAHPPIPAATAAAKGGKRKVKIVGTVVATAPAPILDPSDPSETEPAPGVIPAPKDPARSGSSKSRVAAVLSRSGTKGATVEQIVAETGVDKPRVDAILEAKSNDGDYVEFEGIWRAF